MAFSLPIRRQLALGHVISSGIAVLLLGAWFIAYDYRSFADARARRLNGEAEIVGLNSASAIVFRDPAAAATTLAALKAEASVLSAVVKRTDGSLFASYTRPGERPFPSTPPEIDPAGTIEDDVVFVTRPINFEGERVGSVSIEASLAERDTRLWHQTGITVLAALAAFLVAYLLASRVHRNISEPIQRLSEVARGVSQGKDYAVRATPGGPHEVGQLVATFNEMLENIQRRDSELQESQRALERTIDDRTALYQEAEEANRAKDLFLATLSHELRTPLNAIVGWTAMLSKGILDEETTGQAVATIERNAKAQVKLIEDILDVSRIVSGKLRLSVTRVDVADVVQAAADALSHAAEAKGVQLNLVLPPGGDPVSGDADRLQQVFWNLISNAIKFTPAGGRVDVSLSRTATQARLVVEDDGIGIDPQFLSHVFERFRQADSSSTRNYGGLGLGLAIVRHLIELHGGTVEATSAGTGRGATFTVKLPLARAGTTSGANLKRRAVLPDLELQAGGGRASLGGLVVLVVDDDADGRSLLQRALLSQAATVDVAASVAEAMAALARRVPDVLVSDIGMPEADGYELIRRVRALPRERGGNVPAIALTAYAREEDRALALAQGFQLHLAKPIDPSELVAIVARLAGAGVPPGDGA